MKKKFLRRIVSVVSAAALAVGTACLFAGCTSANPEVTIVYSFNGAEYEVEYVLSRSDAPMTVQHFIELADAGYYDGTCIHDYDDNFLYGGGYTIEDGELVEKNYFSEIKALEASGHSFTQSVYTADANRTPLYTVVGEFTDNARIPSGARENVHRMGALVMYYTAKSGFEGDVTVARADGGSNNDNDPDDVKLYRYNSATSLFYTFLGQSNSSRDRSYAVFGATKDYRGQMQPLLDAVKEYRDSISGDEEEEESDPFLKEIEVTLDTLDHPDDPFFEAVRKSGDKATYQTPVDMPIIITTVRVSKH